MTTSTDQQPCTRTWTFNLPEHLHPLSLNGARGQHFARARKVKAFRQAAAAEARRAGVPGLARVAIELHYAPRDRRRRDPLNLVATLKPVEDGIVDAGVIPDDTPVYSEPTIPVIDPPTGQPGRLYVVVRELVPPPVYLTADEAFVDAESYDVSDPGAAAQWARLVDYGEDGAVLLLGHQGVVEAWRAYVQHIEATGCSMDLATLNALDKLDEDAVTCTRVRFRSGTWRDDWAWFAEKVGADHPDGTDVTQVGGW